MPWQGGVISRHARGKPTIHRCPQQCGTRTPATSSPPATGRYPERRIFYQAYLPAVFPGYPRSLCDPTISYPSHPSIPDCLAVQLPHSAGSRCQTASCRRDSMSVGPSCNPRGRIPPIPGTSGAVCPPSCYPRGSATVYRPPRPSILVFGASMPLYLPP